MLLQKQQTIKNTKHKKNLQTVFILSNDKTTQLAGF